MPAEMRAPREALRNQATLPSLATLWVGGEGGIEAGLVAREGVPYRAIPAAGVHGVGWWRLPHNLILIGRGYLASRRILQEVRPHVIFFTGGYMAVPMALAARFTRLQGERARSLLYVPDIEPGLALKTLARFADRIAVTNARSTRYLPRAAKVSETGYPVRPELIAWSSAQRKAEAFRVLGLTQDLPVLLVFGGSKGARSINRALLAALPELLGECQVVHLSGELDWEEVHSTSRDLAASLSPEIMGRYHPYSYLHAEMGAALAAADLVVCRAGASTLGELPLFGLPAILVPYPYAWRYQQVNASTLAESGAALVLQDGELEERLSTTVRGLLHDAPRLQAMRQGMAALARPNAARSIADLVLNLGGYLGGEP
ncbi:MAG: glycosyltransferase [Anaerolineales bacterium]|nr:glycosyltransferase [Anaerolineales bacterium]